MTFQYPWMLLGLLATLVPILIHLINRHRARVVRFAAIERLIMSDKRLARRVKLRQWLVLALRVALLAALPIALAKPFIPHTAEGADDATPSGAVVLIIDNSLSMGAVPDGGRDQTLLDRGLDLVMNKVRGADELTSFAVVSAGYPARALTGALTYDRPEVMRALERIQLTDRRSDMNAALREAERLLAQTGQRDRQVLLVTDGAQHDWESVGQPWALEDPPKVSWVIQDAGAPSLPNAAITAVEARISQDVTGQALDATVTVVNHGEEPRRTQVTVTVGDATASVSAEVAARSEERVAVRLPNLPDVLARRAVASISDDVLAADNRFFFTTSGQGPLSIGLINGSPNTVAQRDELYFLRPALANLSTVQGERARVRDVALSGLSAAQLAQLDVVILANVGLLPKGAHAALAQFVRTGGGLFIAAGDRLTVEASRTYGELLPLPLRGIKGRDSGLNAQPLRLAKIDVSHPVMEPFGNIERASLFEARIDRFALLDGAPSSVQMLANLTGGAPALVEKALGSGRVMFWSSSLDRDWTDVVVRTSFVPLMHRIVKHLADQLIISQGQRRAGEPVRVRSPEGKGDLVVTLPNGAEHGVEDDPSQREVTIFDTELAGHYELRRRLGDAPVQTFAVNADRRESDLSRADLEALSAALKQAGDRPLPLIERSSVNSAEALPSQHTKLWPWVIFSLFVLLGLEAMLVIRQA